MKYQHLRGRTRHIFVVFFHFKYNVYIPLSQTIKELDGIKNVNLNIADLILWTIKCYIFVFDKKLSRCGSNQPFDGRVIINGMGGFFIFSMEYI